MTTSVSLSTFTRSPRRVLPLLVSGDVLLTRRNGPDLRLSIEPGETSAGPGEDTGDVPVGTLHTTALGTGAVAAGTQPSGSVTETVAPDLPEVSDAIDAAPGSSPGEGRRDLSEPASVELGALLAALIVNADPRRLGTVLRSACPWMADLPPAVQRRFVTDVASSAEPTDGVRGPGEVLDAWRSTSRVFARP